MEFLTAAKAGNSRNRTYFFLKMNTVSSYGKLKESVAKQTGFDVVSSYIIRKTDKENIYYIQWVKQ